jgi:hypothetical protein
MIDRKKIKAHIPEHMINAIRVADERIRQRSIRAAIREQGLFPLCERLSGLVPDISAQYSTFALDSAYLRTKVRAQHAFQISMVEKAFERLDIVPKGGVTLVDIGDSSGTHLQYLRGLYPEIRSLSVNLDAEAVEKIRAKGMEAVHARAEELGTYSIHADLFLSFEMLEHLSDPLRFLHDLSRTECRGFVLTVPYLAASRVGLHHLREGQQREVFAENTHIFELSPEDWRLIFRHSGWEVSYDRVYLQYPQKGVWRVMKGVWRKTDFEGFYGAVLTRDDAWSRLYRDW